MMRAMIVLAHRLAACLTLVTLASAVASALLGPTQAELNEAGSTTDCLLTGHYYRGQRFVDLDEITADNVSTLAEQSTYESGYDGASHTNPLVRNGVMYLTLGATEPSCIEYR